MMVLRLVLLLVASMCFPFRSSSGVVEKERTLAMIKPDGFLGNYTERIKKVIGESGFSIVREMATKFDEETAPRFYAEHSSKCFFSSLVKYITRTVMVIPLTLLHDQFNLLKTSHDV
uniref:Nucleoside diphosphate kinase n=2 Tax=Rhizophora mucronata TaxID=61149 RepID=A0A2P2K5D7_RHIMU